MAEQRLATGGAVSRVVAAVVVVVAAVVSVFAVGVSDAQAAKYLDSSFGGLSGSPALGGTFNAPRDVAVRESTGQVYVVDDSNHRIQRFSAGGVFELAWGRDVVAPGGTNDSLTANWAEVCVVAAECKTGILGTATDGPGGEFSNPQGIAVNQSTGHVYVRDRGNRRVQQFNADGVFIRAWGADVITNASPSDPTSVTGFQICEVAADCKPGVSGSGDGQFATSTTNNAGVAIHPTTGDVFVADPGTGNRRVQQFQADGDFVATFGSTGSGLGQFATNQPGHVAVDAEGIVYASDGSANGSSRIQRYDTATGSFLEPIGVPPLLAATTAATGTMGLEIDAATGNLMVLRDPNAAGVETVVQEIDPSGALVDTHGQGAGFAAVNGLGINTLTGELYVSTSAGPAGGGHRVYVLDDNGADPQPDVTVGAPADIGAHTARLEGTINPNGTPYTTSYRFEISKNGVDWTAVGDDVDLGNGTDPIDVSQNVDGLEANTFYRVRIVTTRSQGAGVVVSSELTFSTDRVAPEVSQPAVQHRTATTAQLVGVINPNNLPTTYWFEYGTTTAYGTTVPVPAASMPVVGTDTAVMQQIAGLAPNTTYHYRLVARNAEGEVATGDATFATRVAVQAPQGRAYEMVTSPDKVLRRGGERGTSGTDYARFQGALPAPDGEATTWNIFGGITDPDAGNSYAHDRAWEIRHRTPTGWRGDALVTVPPYVPGDASDTVLGAISADLGTSLWQHATPFYPSRMSTHVMGDTGGPRGAGWYPWLDAAWYDGNQGAYVVGDGALVDDDGERLVRFNSFGTGQEYRDLVGADGTRPDQTLNPPQTSGKALWLSGPPIWRPLELINECTGTTGGATDLPARDDNGTPADLADDVLGERECGAGSPTSVRGAALGAGSEPDRSLSGTAITAMSDDGSRVFFLSPDPGTFPSSGAGLEACTPATGAATSCPPQLFVRQYDDAGNATVRWISRAEPGLFGGQQIGQLGGVSFEGASRDGQVVYFRTNSPLTADDPNGGMSITTGVASPSSWDLYRYELPGDRNTDPAGGELTRISGGPDIDADPGSDEDPSTNVADGAGASVRFMSDSGDRVYFVTTSPIGDADDPWNVSPDGSTVPGGAVGNSVERNLYLYDANKPGNDQYRFIARLPFSTDDGLEACASSNAIAGGAPRVPGTTSSGGSRLRAVSSSCVRGTSSGDAIVFETPGRLTGGDTDTAGDVYVYDSDDNSLTRVSAPEPGAVAYTCLASSSGEVTARCNGDLGIQSAESTPVTSREMVGIAGLRHANVAENGDGSLRAVYFESRLPLVGGDRNGPEGMDVYEWRDGELSLISPGDSENSAFYSGNSRDGEDVFFWSEQRISPWEIDGADGDIYNARVGGGFAPPPAPPTTCGVLSDGCQQAGPVPLAVPAPQTRGSGGDGDARPTVRASVSLARLSAAARRRAARTGVLRVRVRTSSAGVVRLGARARIGRRSVKVAGARKRATRAGAMTVRLRLNGRARKVLGRGRVLRVTLRVAQADARTRSATVRLERGARS